MNIDRIISEAIRKVVREETEMEMTPTVEWMTRKYNEFNASIFDGKLPRCQLKVAALPDNTLGSFKRSKAALMRSMFGMGVPLLTTDDGDYISINKSNYYTYIKPRITLNSSFSAAESMLENTLIHEMCHYYTCFDENGEARAIDRENNGHGADFEEACKLVTERTNGQVTIKKIADSEKMDSLKVNASFNKGGYKIIKLKFTNCDAFMITKDEWVIKFFKGRMDGYTENPNILYQLKRYRYQNATTSSVLKKWTSRAYTISGLPDHIKEMFDKETWRSCSELLNKE